MYPALPGSGPERPQPPSAYNPGQNFHPDPPPALSSQYSGPPGWGDTHSSLRVVIAEEYRLDPPVRPNDNSWHAVLSSDSRDPCRFVMQTASGALLPMFLQVQLPPAMKAATRPQKAVDFDFERKVMQEEASTSQQKFINRAEVCAKLEACTRNCTSNKSCHIYWGLCRLGAVMCNMLA